MQSVRVVRTLRNEGPWQTVARQLGTGIIGLILGQERATCQQPSYA